MHTLFRIGSTESINKNDRLDKVDPDCRPLMSRIEQEFEDGNPWQR